MTAPVLVPSISTVPSDCQIVLPLTCTVHLPATTSTAMSPVCTVTVCEPMVDGMVIQPLMVSPGVSKNGLGSARYAKYRNEWTVDVALSGTTTDYVLEYSLEDIRSSTEEGWYLSPGAKPIRERTDKTTGNSEGQILRMMESEEPDFIIKYLTITTGITSMHIDEAIPVLRKIMSGGRAGYGKAIADLSVKDLMIIYFTDCGTAAYGELSKRRGFESIVERGHLQEYKLIKDKVSNYVYHSLPRLMADMGDNYITASDALRNIVSIAVKTKDMADLDRALEVTEVIHYTLAELSEIQ